MTLRNHTNEVRIELPVLGRLRQDRAGYVWVRTEIDDATQETKEGDAAADAIRQRQ